MAWPFQSIQPKKRNQVVAIDLGSRTTKAVEVQRRGTGFELLGFLLKDAPLPDRTPAGTRLTEHLKQVVQDLGTRQRQIVLVVGVGEAFVRRAEMPQMPINDMRQMLRFNSKNYLQQDLPDHTFDCYLLPPRPGAAAELAKPGQKLKVLVGGARRQAISELETAAKGAGLGLEMVVPGVVGPANAFELAHPELFGKEVVALVDIGYKNTTISVLHNGELALSRVVGIGGEKLTGGLAEALGLNGAEAEKLKLAMPEEVQVPMQALLMPLGHELRASMEFFEKEQDKTVTQVFISGGAARSEFIVRNLKEELMLETKTWNPLTPMQLSLPPAKMAELEQAGPQLTVAVGAALAAF